MGQISVMSEPVDRRAFFTLGFRRLVGKASDAVGNTVSGGGHVRPPGALPEAAFLGACTRCGECSRMCPVQAIKPLGVEYGFAAGTPALNLSLQACVMCTNMPCATVCPTDALMVPEELWRGTMIASITIDSERCIAYRDVECGICARACPVGERALKVNDRGRPVLGPDCTGCGTCISACVTSPSSIAAHVIGRSS